MKRWPICVVAMATLCYTVPTYALLIARGNNSSPLTFKTTVTSKVFDRATGTLYLGLNNPPLDSYPSNGAYAISKVARHISSDQPVFQGIATNASISGKPIEYLALATYEGNTKPVVVGGYSRATLSFEINKDYNKGHLYYGQFSSQSVFAMNNDGSNYHETEILRDAGQYQTLNALPTSGIVALAASERFVFATVQANENPFGVSHGGIAVVCIDPDTLEVSQTAAQPGNGFLRARRLDPSTPEIYIQTPPAAIVQNQATMYWDDKLQRLYTGIQLESAGGTGDGIRSVVVGRTDCGGVLEYSPIAPDSAATQSTITAQKEIVVARTDDIIDGTVNLSTMHLGIMHTSPGPSYLIVNGGNGIALQTNPYIFALPLVDDPQNAQAHGTLARKDAALVNTKFVTPATAPGHLVQNPAAFPGPGDNFALVGGTPLPLNVDSIVSEMVVVGDTVYVAINDQQSKTNETGVFYSQAQFDNDGKITGWTPWSKRAFPYACESCCGNNVKYVAVDAVTGQLWAVYNNEGNAVAVTQWDHGWRTATETSLVYRLNETFPCGCTAVLDLDQATYGFSETAHRYALFGGQRTVAFARTSMSQKEDGDSGNYQTYEINPLNAYYGSPYAQTVMKNFADPQNFLVTTLPPEAGCVTALDYARQWTTEITQEEIIAPFNYFFAGTTNGLYVFAKPGGNGFDVTDLQELNSPLFVTGGWYKAPNIEGNIIAIKASTASLYVLTRNPSTRIDTLYRIDYASNIQTMFSTIYILAQTKTGFFKDVTMFTDIQLMHPAIITSPFITEQLVLSTNNGLYQSSVTLGTNTATSDKTTFWQLVQGSSKSLYPGIGSVDLSATIWGIAPNIANPTDAVLQVEPKSVWPIRSERSAQNQCQRSSIHQLNINNNLEVSPTSFYPFTFAPSNFNGGDFVGLPPINYFWSDGARRFFIVNPGQDRYCSANACKTNLMVLPHDTAEWNVTDPLSTMLRNEPLRNECNYYWVRHIGATGILMAGTSKGVIALE